MKPTTHFHEVPRLRMHGIIPPLTQHICMTWFLVKQRNNFTFTLYK